MGPSFTLGYVRDQEARLLDNDWVLALPWVMLGIRTALKARLLGNDGVLALPWVMLGIRTALKPGCWIMMGS